MDVGQAGAADGAPPEDAPTIPAKALEIGRQRARWRVTLHRALHTVRKMVEDRGYVVRRVGTVVLPLDAPSGEELRLGVDAAIDDFASLDRAALAESNLEVVLEAVVPPAPKPYTAVWALEAPADTKLVVVAAAMGNTDVVRDLWAAMEPLRAKHMILITRDVLTAPARRLLTESGSPRGRMQHFQYEDLQGAVGRHRLVPMHAPLRPEAAATVLKRYAPGKLHGLRPWDPMVKYLDLPHGTVVMLREVLGRQQATITFSQVWGEFE